jgi:hypothetical protein
MFGWLKRGAKPPSDGPTLDDLRFDTDGYEYQGEPQPSRMRFWYTPAGDGVGLYLFPIPPDIPPAAESVERLREFYAARVAGAGSSLVELDVSRRPAATVVRIILKVPQEPSGFTYIGSVTVPFRDFSYVIKVQCEERGTTGVREAVLMDRRLGAGDMTEIHEGGFRLANWSSDDEQHDADFPDHPVTRARRVLKRVEQSLVVDARIRGLPGFALPDPEDGHANSSDA